MSLSPPVTPRSATKAHAAAYVSLDNRASESTTNPKCISLWNFVPTQEFQKFRRDPSGVVNNSVNFDRRPSPVSYSQHARESASTHKMTSLHPMYRFWTNWPSTLIFCVCNCVWAMTIARWGLKAKIKDRLRTSTDGNAVGLASILDRRQFGF